MCGFIGVYSKNSSSIKYSESQLRRLLHHRGPDHSSLLKADNLLLVHNRLSIIDLSENANQPFISPDTNSILSFNGEIYNYKELKKKYKDINWKTNSDTEVIIRLYDLLGPRFVCELNGIFAFAIYDKRNHKLLLYRDRVGVKPLYCKITNETIYFSSEVRGILYFLGNYRPNYKVVYDYIEFGLMCHNEDTFIEGVYRLSPGTYLEVNLDNWQCLKTTYWDIGFIDISHKSESQVYEEALFLLQDSVRLNLVSDVEIGLSLSSGLDSTLLFHLLKEQGAHSLMSFTFGFKENKYDEVSRVGKNNLLALYDHHPVYLHSKKMLDTLKEAIYFFEAPCGGLGSLSVYNMMKSVKDAGIKVMLAGEGADEVFGGYQYYYPAFFKDIEYDSALLSNEIQYYNRAHNKEASYTTGDYKEFAQSVFSDGVMAPDGTSLKSTYCSNELLALIKDKNKEHKEGQRYLSALKSMMYIDLKKKKVPKLLFFKDRESMANSVETRVPYLDHRLIELMYAVPSKFKIKNGQTKCLARKILSEHFGVTLSTDVKHYVSTPQREWLKGELYDDIVELLMEGSLIKTKLLQFKNFFSDYKQYREKRELGNSFFVWKLINLEFVFKLFSNV